MSSMMGVWILAIVGHKGCPGRLLTTLTIAPSLPVHVSVDHSAVTCVCLCTYVSGVMMCAVARTFWAGGPVGRVAGL